MRKKITKKESFDSLKKILQTFPNDKTFEKTKRYMKKYEENLQKNKEKK